MLRLSRVIGKLISSEQSGFIKGRQILDGPLMVSEVMEWYKSKNKKLMVFKLILKRRMILYVWSTLIM